MNTIKRSMQFLYSDNIVVSEAKPYLSLVKHTFTLLGCFQPIPNDATFYQIYVNLTSGQQHV